MTVVSMELDLSSKSYYICCQTDKQKKNILAGDFNSRAAAYKIGCCFTERNSF